MYMDICGTQLLSFENKDYNSDVDLVCKSSSSDHCYLMLTVNDTGLILTENSIECPYIYANPGGTYEPNMYIRGDGTIIRTTTTSSKRYKKDIQDLTNTELNPQKLYELKVKQFKYRPEFLKEKNDNRYNKDLIGFVAEEVEKVYPVAVDYITDKNGNKVVDNWNVRYMIPAMLKLIQEQHKEMQELSTKVEELENKIKEKEENNG